MSECGCCLCTTYSEYNFNAGEGREMKIHLIWRHLGEKKGAPSSSFLLFPPIRHSSEKKEIHFVPHPTLLSPHPKPFSFPLQLSRYIQRRKKEKGKDTLQKKEERGVVPLGVWGGSLLHQKELVRRRKCGIQLHLPTFPLALNKLLQKKSKINCIRQNNINICQIHCFSLGLQQWGNTVVAENFR